MGLGMVKAYRKRTKKKEEEQNREKQGGSEKDRAGETMQGWRRGGQGKRGRTETVEKKQEETEQGQEKH